MEGARLRQARLWSACLDLANLSRADLSFAELEDASAEDADFSEATLRGVEMSRTNLKGADFSDAVMAGAALHETHLEGANLEGILGTPIPFADIYIDDRTKLPKSAGDWVMISWIKSPRESHSFENEKREIAAKRPNDDAEDTSVCDSSKR